MKKTKIICTLGPSTDSEACIKKMVKAGMNVARLNFSHGTHEEQKVRMDMVKKVREELETPVAIMLDTKGPEYRIGTFENRNIVLKDGAEFTFTSKNIVGNEKMVSVSYPGIVTELEKDDVILVNDGLVQFKVTGKSKDELHCKTIVGGKLTDRKSMSFPGKTFKHVYLSAQDKKDLLFGIENDVDFVACSFVSRAQDILEIRKFLDKNGGNDIQLIAKIENQTGVDNALEILQNCEGLMVARGDLGVEVPYVELPLIQKHLVKLCRKVGGISIIATEMLESMTYNARPTRAEISDVANAVYDGCSAVMLSGETAAGKYPVESVKAMAKIAETSENSIDYENRFRSDSYLFANVPDAISHAACQLALDSEAKCIVACTITGQTARMISRFRVPTVIIGLSPTEKAYRQLALSWNVVPMMTESAETSEHQFTQAHEAALLGGFAKKGDVVVATGGITNKKRATSLIQATQL